VLQPHPGLVSPRLEVSGPSLIELEVRLRTAIDSGEQVVSTEGPLVGEERRLYE